MFLPGVDQGLGVYQCLGIAPFMSAFFKFFLRFERKDVKIQKSRFFICEGRAKHLFPGQKTQYSHMLNLEVIVRYNLIVCPQILNLNSYICDDYN